MARDMKTVLSLFGFRALYLASVSSIAQIIPYDSELIEENYAAEIQAHRVDEEKNIRNFVPFRDATSGKDSYGGGQSTTINIGK